MPTEGPSRALGRNAKQETPHLQRAGNLLQQQALLRVQRSGLSAAQPEHACVKAGDAAGKQGGKTQRIGLDDVHGRIYAFGVPALQRNCARQVRRRQHARVEA